ncbi:MAG: riboflavin synthase [Nitrospirae bacterium]|nr:riboflavin synthase [Nitrospirota bacterium]
MFSGLVEEMGVINKLERGLAGARLSVMAHAVLDDLDVGDSISVAGVCLTVVSFTEQEFFVDVSTETLQVTNLGALAVGGAVNLERALMFHERVGGHLVSGHVDGIGVVRERHQDHNTLNLTIEAEEDILKYCIAKGSITVDGISLTINGISDKGFTVAIIPHTATVTTIGLKQVGDSVNLETDLIGKYVERLLQHSGQLPKKDTPVIDRDYLQKRGLL